MKMKIHFSQIESEVPEQPGIYEIHTKSGIPLKVSIGKNLRKRLLRHRASRQSGLHLKPNGGFNNPNDVISKGSILAKHLYYDESITNEYNLKDEAGRRNFLIEKCCVFFEPTDTKQTARDSEKLREQSGAFQYVGEVIVRKSVRVESLTKK